MFLVLSKKVFRSREEEFIQESWEQHREESARRRQQVLTVFWKHRGECEIPALEPARENAEQRIGGSQRGHPSEREVTPFIRVERVQSVKNEFLYREDRKQYFPRRCSIL